MLRSRVAKVSLVFWIIKILSTGLGETGADYLDHTYSPIAIVALAFVALIASLIWQLSAKRYSALRYWLAVVMVSVFGTLAADAVHVALGVEYWVSTLVFAVALVLIFGLWFRQEGRLEMSDINTARRELYYWAAVMASFALGTAAGDWMAISLGLGFLGGTFVFTLLFALPLVLRRLGWLASVPAFWVAYTFTRPMGASFADWLALPPERGGLGLGTLLVTGLWFILILIALAIRPGRRASIAA
jgi:uncharacterized membrane-anchored protein